MIIIELCYNIRFFQRNGRTTGDPWSLRQVGVYQKHNGPRRCSVWIFISVGDTPQKALETAKKPGVFDFGQSPINSSMFHGILLKTTAHEWQDYLQSLNAQLDLLVRITQPIDQPNLIVLG